MPPVPPTNILACSGQDNCLSQATEYSLTAETFGRGVQQTPADFVASAQNSLTSSNNTLFPCANGICRTNTSGTYSLSATATQSIYYGQCRGYGTTVNTPGQVIPAVTSALNNVQINNRPPVATVNIASDPITVNQEVNVTCDIVDPDDCTDRIARIRWTCVDSNGQSGNCFLWRADTGAWTQGTTSQDLVPSERTNPFRATTIFRAGVAGNYAITCEAWDDDVNNPLSGTGMDGVVVTGGNNCGQDSVCNPNCNPPDPDCAHCGQDGVCVQGCNPPDPDCNNCGQNGVCNPNCNPPDPDCQGVIGAHSGYCAVISDEGETNNTVCGGSGESKYRAYFSGMEPAAYKWQCSANDAVKETTDPSLTCSYSSTGSYTPALSIVDSRGTETKCSALTSTSVRNSSGCQVELRKSGSENDYKSNVSITLPEQVEARINRQCLSGGTTKWEVGNATLVSQDNNSAEINYNVSGNAQVKAQVTTPDGRTTQCDAAEVNTKEKMQWGL